MFSSCFWSGIDFCSPDSGTKKCEIISTAALADTIQSAAKEVLLSAESQGIAKVGGEMEIRKKQEENLQQSVQDWIPIRGIYNEMIETKDQRLIKILAVTAINTHLMSYAEEREVLEGYESFLKTLDKPIQIMRVAEPIDLKDYIFQLRKRYRKEQNPYKRKMLKSYIEYAKQLQENREMIRRNRYVIIDEKFTSLSDKEKAIERLRMRANDLKLGIEEMLYQHKLEAYELSNNELKKLLHMMLDYENAQIYEIEDAKHYPYQIGPRNLIEAAERLKKKEEYSF